MERKVAIVTGGSRGIGAATAIRLAQALETLPEDQREAVRLRYLEGQSLAEIVDHMSKSKDAVASLLKRGMRNLRKQLAEPS